jgi:hypothetical protein
VHTDLKLNLISLLEPIRGENSVVVVFIIWIVEDLCNSHNKRHACLVLKEIYEVKDKVGPYG